MRQPSNSALFRLTTLVEHVLHYCEATGPRL